MSTVDVRPDELDDDGDAAALLACHTRVLALLSSNTARQTVLDEITNGLEELIPNSRCSLLLVEPAGTLRHASAPTLPRTYLAAIDGLVPGPRQGACGTAAYLADVVVVEDIATDDRWDGYQDVAAAAQLRSCWSTPVLGRSGRVAGTLAVYHHDAYRPTPRQLTIVEQLTQLVSVVLDHSAMIGELTVSEERFRGAFESNATAMGLLDTRGVFREVNTAMRALAGDRLVPGTTTLAEVVASATADEVSALLDDVRAGRLRQAQCETRVSDGQGERVVSLTMSLVRAADGEAHQVSVHLLDLTERIAARRERRARLDAELARRAAEAASRAKSAFLAEVSHEMRTPLQAITGFAELLTTLDLDTAKRAEAMRHIRAGASHLLELVDDTLDLSRIEANAVPLTMQPVAAGPLVAGVLEFLAPVAEQHDVRLQADPCDGAAQADERRLRQVLINLVTNAVRYAGPDALVRVGAVSSDGLMRIVVSDNGPGIARELRGRLFEPFAQSGVHGIGLGLMLASRLTEAMGGRLTIDDPDDGTGTVATVTLPAARLSARSPRAAGGSAATA